MAGVDDLLDSIKKLDINSEACYPDTQNIKEEVKVKDGQIFFDVVGHGHQSYFSWVDPEKFEEGGATAKEIIEILEDRFLETTDNQEIALKYNCVELIGDKGSLAYTNFFIGNLTEAKAALAEARDFIQKCSRKKFVDEEYLTGFDYVFDSLEVYMDTKQDVNSEEDPDIWAKLPTFEELSGKSKAAVFALQFYFYRQLRNDFDNQLTVANKMTQLDPGYFEWHLCRASILRYQRRQVRYDLDQPFNPAIFTNEIAEIEMAKSLAPDDPVCSLEYCQLLAEIMKRSKRIYQDWQTPLKCGNLEFSSLQDTVVYLKRESRKILECYQQSVRVNVTLADIFMKWIPRKHRDLDFAKLCLLRALKLHPKSSKANHRLANFHMGIDTLDIEEAERFCIEAVACDPRNFPAVADLIQIMLGKPKENESRIKDILDSHLNESTTSPFEKRKAELLFFKGLFLHLKSGYENEATEEWLKAQEVDPKVHFDFDALFYRHDRYNWPPGHLVIPKIRETIQYSMTDASFSKGKEKEIERLMACLDKAELKEQTQRAIEISRRGRGGSHRGEGRGSDRRGGSRGSWDGQNGTSRGHRGEYRGQRGHRGHLFRGSGGSRGGDRGRGGCNSAEQVSADNSQWR